MMTVAQQLVAIRDALKAWVATNGGAAFIASDISHMWHMATATSDKPRVIIAWNGEDIRGEFPTAAPLSRVDRHFIVLVTRGKKLDVDREEGALSFPGLVESTRDVCRNLSAIAAEPPVDYKSVRPVEFGNIIMDGYRIDFSADADLTGYNINT